MRTIFLFLFFLSSSAHSGDSGDAWISLFQERAGGDPDASLLRWNAPALLRYLSRVKRGDPFTLPVPGGSAEFSVAHVSLRPQDDLDCCFIALESARGNATIQLTRKLELLDFEARIDGNSYRFHANGKHFLIVKGKRLSDSP